MADRRATARSMRGFTLVELLVALAVMALLSVMSWRGLDAMSRTQALTQTRSNAVQALRNGLAQWVADLDAMDTDLPAARTLRSTPSPLEWDGLSLRITRHSADTEGPGLQVVAWTARTEQGRKVWLRWQSPTVRSRAALQLAWTQAAQWAENPSAASRANQVRIVPLLDWQLFYFRGDSWSNPSSTADAASVTPDAIRLQLHLPEDQPLSGKVTRDWMRATAGGSKS